MFWLSILFFANTAWGTTSPTDEKIIKALSSLHDLGPESGKMRINGVESNALVFPRLDNKNTFIGMVRKKLSPDYKVVQHENVHQTIIALLPKSKDSCRSCFRSGKLNIHSWLKHTYTISIFNVGKSHMALGSPTGATLLGKPTVDRPQHPMFDHFVASNPTKLYSEFLFHRSYVQNQQVLVPENRSSVLNDIKNLARASDYIAVNPKEGDAPSSTNLTSTSELYVFQKKSSIVAFHLKRIDENQTSLHFQEIITR